LTCSYKGAGLLLFNSVALINQENHGNTNTKHTIKLTNVYSRLYTSTHL